LVKNKERTTTLKGEAYFVVAKDSTRPFIVKAEETTTKVLGTKFNLKAVENSGEVEISVEEGRVSFSNSTKTIILIKGEQGIVHGNLSLEKKEFKNDIIFSWKENKLAFEHTSIGEVIPTVEHFFNVKIIYPETLNSLAYTGNYTGPSLKDFFSAFTSSLNLQYKIKNDTVFISTALYKVTDSGNWVPDSN
jgi:transmembrane sensor